MGLTTIASTTAIFQSKSQLPTTAILIAKLASNRSDLVFAWVSPYVEIIKELVTGSM